MHDCCPACGLHFNREAGYFLGAMYISYGLALAFIFALGATLWFLTGWRLDKIAIWGSLVVPALRPDVDVSFTCTLDLSGPEDRSRAPLEVLQPVKNFTPGATKLRELS